MHSHVNYYLGLVLDGRTGQVIKVEELVARYNELVDKLEYIKALAEPGVTVYDFFRSVAGTEVGHQPTGPAVSSTKEAGEGT